MKITLHKYIINEIWPIFFSIIFVAVFIIMATKMLPLTEMILIHGINPLQIGGMIIYLLPDIILFAMPAAGLLSVLIAFLRLSDDNEIIALRSLGLGLYQMLPPVILLSFIGLCLSLVISFTLVPWGNRSFKNILFEVAQSKADLGIKERIFCEPFENIIFFVNQFSTRDRKMRNVFLVDKRDQEAVNTIIAEEGEIYMHPGKKIITIHFHNGTIFVVEKKMKASRTIKFRTYDLNIDLGDMVKSFSSREHAPKEMKMGELILKLKTFSTGDINHNEMLIEFFERITIPIGVFFMGIIGLALGSQIQSRERTSRIGMGLSVFLAYYLLLAGARSFCETGAINPLIGVWIPDIALCIVCCYFFKRVRSEKSVDFLPSIKVIMTRKI